tara:strand:+ start:28 stop:393 length:366 start_codon:yes stop_codon:yes gene_type:complete
MREMSHECANPHVYVSLHNYHLFYPAGCDAKILRFNGMGYAVQSTACISENKSLFLAWIVWKSVAVCFFTSSSRFHYSLALHAGHAPDCFVVSPILIITCQPNTAQSLPLAPLFSSLCDFD